MPCIFCVAVLMMISGALTAAHVDDLETRLCSQAENGDVRRTVDSESLAKFELTVSVGSISAPVAVTVFKHHRRVRVQVLTHELLPEEVEQLEERLAEALDAEVVHRSDAVEEEGDGHAVEHAVPTSERVRPTKPPRREAGP